MNKSLNETTIMINHSINTKCMYETGSNIISAFSANKSLVKNEIKQYTNTNQKANEKNSTSGVVNHETFMNSLKLVGDTLGL
jgi:superoxide dismutase